jgi:hypothetical protein
MARRHLPIPIMAMFFGTAAISVGMIGFGNGRVGRRFSMLDAVYGIALAAALWRTDGPMVLVGSGTHFIAAKVSTTGRLLTLMRPIPG